MKKPKKLLKEMTAKELAAHETAKYMAARRRVADRKKAKFEAKLADIRFEISETNVAIAAAKRDKVPAPPIK